jgi:V8-like Glu-specific endopeptidase
MKNLITFILFLSTNIVLGQQIIDKSIALSTRDNSIKIISKEGNSSGTGFFISNDLIVTCFHVIASISQEKSNNIKFGIFKDLKAINEYGDTVLLSCISIPNNQYPEPLFQDFAILKTNRIISKKVILPLADDSNFDVLDNIYFTGYPFGIQTKLTHLGTISGVSKDKSIFSIQASTNKGNSGGALINNSGKIIGIISLREGGISMELQNYLNEITKSEKNGSIQLMGIDPLKTSKETIKILDTYISTGIGYARNISFLKSYIAKQKIKL